MIALICSDGFIGYHAKIWAEKLGINHIGVYFKDCNKGDIHFKEFINSNYAEESKTLVITGGNSDHGLARKDFFTALKKDLCYLMNFINLNPNTNIVFLSSAAVYYGHVGEVSEEAQIITDDFYGLCKIFAEYLVKLIIKKLEGRLIIFRLTNAFGKNERKKRLFDKILDCLKTGETFHVYGKGQSFINPVPVAKVGEILVKSGLEISSLYNKGDIITINLGSNENIKVIDIIKYMELKYGLNWEFSCEEEYPVKFIAVNKKLNDLLIKLNIELEAFYKSMDELILNQIS